MFIIKLPGTNANDNWYAATPCEEVIEKVCSDGAILKMTRYYFTITKNPDRAYKFLSKQDAFDFVGKYNRSGFIDGPIRIVELKF